MSLVKGSQLKNQKLCRIIMPSKIHNDYEWHEGVNVDPLPFNPSGACQHGGLYFTTPEWVLKFRHRSEELDDHYIGQIQLDNDEAVWQEKTYTGQWSHYFYKWKAHTVTLVNMTKISDMSDAEYYDLIGHRILKKSPEPYDKLKQHEQWLNLISHKPKALKYVRHQTQEICLTAVNFKRSTIKHVKARYLPQCLAIIVRDGHFTPRVFQSVSVLKTILANDGMRLSQIPSDVKTQEMVDIAVANNPEAARYAGKKFLTSHPELFYQCFGYYPRTQ